MSAWTDFMNADFGDDKPISRRLSQEAHRVGNLGDSKAEKLLRAVLPAIAELEGSDLAGLRRGADATPQSDIRLSEKPSDIARAFVGMTQGIPFPRLADVTAVSCEDCRTPDGQGNPPILELGAMMNGLIGIVGRLEHELVKLTSQPINVPPTG